MSKDAGHARRLAFGCAAGMAIAAAGTWLRFSLEHTLRLDARSRGFIVASAVSGAGLLLAAISSHRLARQAEGLAMRTLLAVAAGVHGLSATALALTSSDSYTCLALGELGLAGLSPWVYGPAALTRSSFLDLVPARWAHDPSPYGPLLQPFVVAAAWAGRQAGLPLWGTFYAYKLLLLAALLTAFFLAASFLRDREGGRETLALLALTPLLAWEVSAQAHNDGLLFLALVAFAVAAGRGKTALAAAALAAGVAIKYALAPLLGLFLVMEARRELRRGLAGGFAALGVLALCFAPVLGSITLRSVLPMVGGEAARHTHSLTDLVCLLLEASGHPRASFGAYRVLSALSGLACAGFLVRAAVGARDLPGLVRRYLHFLFALYLTAPWFQPWYVAWALPLLVIEPDPRWRRFVALFATMSVVQWAAPLDPVTTLIGDAWAVWQLCRLARTGEPGGRAVGAAVT